MAELPEDKLHGELSKYKCTKDKDIESFLQTKAITYERRGWCSTYLLVDGETFRINGFFTLSNIVLKLSETVSNRSRKKIFNGVKKDDKYAHFILIGQLGKHIDNTNRMDSTRGTSAKELLDSAFSLIYEVKERITCNCVLVECNDHPKLRKVYEDYGFCELQKDGDVIQYAKML